MANWSDFECSFYGTKENINKLEEELNKHITDDWFYMPNPNPKDDNSKTEQWGWSGVSDVEINKTDNELVFQGQGRWHGPYSTVKYLADKYKLDANYNDIEQGCAFYHKMEFKDGKEILDKEYNFLSKESVKHLGTEYFRDNYEYIWEEENVFKDDIELIIELLDLEVYTKDDFNEKELALIESSRTSASGSK